MKASGEEQQLGRVEARLRIRERVRFNTNINKQIQNTGHIDPCVCGFRYAPLSVRVHAAEHAVALEAETEGRGAERRPPTNYDGMG